MKATLFLFLLCFIGMTQSTAAPPDWLLNPADYANQANIIARLEVDTALDNNPNNIIGFFVGEEVRAVATPITVGGSEQYYFITIYSNVSSGETMAVKAYLATNDQIYTANDSYDFVKSKLDGSIDNPFIITLSTDGDLPIDLLPVEEQITLQNYAFTNINLADILVQNDNDPIQWTYQGGGNLIGNISQGMFQVQAVDPNWTGSQVMTLTGTEISSNQYTASIDILYTVVGDYSGPAWGTIPGETINPGQTFAPFNLNDYENEFEGNCMDFSWEPILEIPLIWSSSPDWTVHPPDYQYTMTITARVNFSGNYYFVGENDKLGAFINGEERGHAQAVMVNGEPYYFITVYSSLGGEITLKFFSSDYRDIYTVPERIPFQANSSLGTPDEPKILNAAPLTVEINEFGETQVIILEPTWQGEQTFAFTATDCDLPYLKNAVTYATFIIDDQALATDLLDFSGKWMKDDVDLEWTMGATEHLKGFEVERAAKNNASEWEAIAFVRPTHAHQKYFSLKDGSPLKEGNYYRLKIWDSNEKFEYSPIVFVERPNTAKELHFFPNPIQDGLSYMQLNSAIATNGQIRLYNAMAQLVRQQEWTVEIGQNELFLNLTDLPKGIYELEVELGNQRWLEKIVR